MSPTSHCLDRVRESSLEWQQLDDGCVRSRHGLHGRANEPEIDTKVKYGMFTLLKRWLEKIDVELCESE